MVLLAAVPISVALGHRLRDRWQAALHVTVLLYLVGVIRLNAFLNAMLTGELTARHLLFPMIAAGVAHLGRQLGDLWAKRTQLRVDVGRAVKLDPRVPIWRCTSRHSTWWPSSAGCPADARPQFGRRPGASRPRDVSGLPEGERRPVPQGNVFRNADLEQTTDLLAPASVS